MEPSAFSNLKVFLSFGPFFKPHRKRITRWFLVYGAYFLAGIVTPYAFKVYIDDVISRSPADPMVNAFFTRLGLAPAAESRVWVFCGLYLCYALVLQTLNFIGNLGTARIIEDVVAELRAVVFEKLHRVHLRFFDRTLSGEIVNQVTTDTRQLLNLVGGDLVNVTLSTLMGLASLAILACWNRQLAIIVVAFIPAYAWLFHRYLPLVHRAARLWRRAEDYLWGNWGEKLKGMSVIQAFARERSEALKHYEFGHRSSDTWYRMSMFGVVMGNWGGFTAGISSHAAYAVGCLLVYNGSLSLGELVTLYLFISFILAPVQGAFNLVNTWQQSSVSAQRIQSLLAEVEEDSERDRKRRAGRLMGRIEIEDLGFQYEPGRPVLKSLSLAIEPGESVALVGHTGCGKTTLIQLIQGFYRPQQGRLLLDGIPIEDLDARSLRRNIGVVPQELTLFQDSLRANVAYGRPEATDAELWTVLDAAQIGDYARSLPLGLDTRIGGEQGILPSRGQGQRLAIARALLIDPSLVILDEATSSLDSLEEARLQAAIDLLLKGRTALVIAHRLSTLERCHRIVVMEGGRILEQGPPSTLLADPASAYSRLHRAHYFRGEA